MKNNIPDQLQREQALNPQHSFIVQAPAGSGKTELLVRRFLRLLSVVEKEPEEILTITFTRKAAAEMRSRIITALQNAKTNKDSCNDNSISMSSLAQAALMRDQQNHWELLENPNRLRIQTIDALCSNLTKQMPILSSFGAQSSISNDPQSLYEKAANHLLLQIDDSVEWANDIKQFLGHLDNKITTGKKLLSAMLAKRDQWLPHILKSNVREELENNLYAITQDALINIKATIPLHLTDELNTLIKYAFQNLEIKHENNLHDIFNQIENTSKDKTLIIKDLWVNIANLLLTQTNEWRKTVNKRIGFPAETSANDSNAKSLFAEMKNRMQELLNALENNEDFRQALIELKVSPSIRYSNQQWKILTALLKLLPLAAAELKLVFQETGQVDFSEISQAAITALGSPERPTDLALILDYKIHHILIDEFQDTSTSQFQLLEQLTTGWENNDGRTLFIVGDPMQSIYRFRDADVGLFLRAQYEGIGNIKLKPLNLSVNFRSNKNLIQWVNQTFEKMFPHMENMSTGAVTHHPSIPNHDISEHHKIQQSIYIHPLIDSNELTQAQTVIDIIKKQQHECPDDTIAILVKSRNHLTEILAALRIHDLHYQAIDIDPLDTRPIIQDLFALTKALCRPADRIAWLSILRAPWCGLILNDLHIIAYKEPEKTIWERINSQDVFNNLSLDGQQRLNELILTLHDAFKKIQRTTLRKWINDTWEKLKGPACLKNKTDLQDVKAFFSLLETQQVGKTIKDFVSFKNKIHSLYSSQDTQSDNHLQIMTIHKAKGLEFDTVILPSLERIPFKQESQLLLWLQRTRAHHQSDLILAPIKSATDQQDAIYYYINREESLKNSYEDMRLLYVAATRAKKSLHLIGNICNNPKKEILKKPIEGSFLNLLWPSLKESFISHKHVLTNIYNNVKPMQIKTLRRLPIQSFNYSKQVGIQLENIDNPPPQFNDSHSLQVLHSHVGTLTHSILQQIAQDDLEQWKAKDLSIVSPYWKSSLTRLGVLPNQLDEAVNMIQKAIINTLQDTKGQWILNHHTDTHTEYAISTSEKNKLQTYIIDRTFIDEKGIRWIVDYKTAGLKNGNQTLKSFLHDEKQRHQQQLENYGHVLKKIFAEEIRYGLYFPMIPAWIEWK